MDQLVILGRGGCWPGMAGAILPEVSANLALWQTVNIGLRNLAGLLGWLPASPILIEIWPHSNSMPVSGWSFE
mgnify:FL=1